MRFLGILVGVWILGTPAEGAKDSRVSIARLKKSTVRIRLAKALPKLRIRGMDLAVDERVYQLDDRGSVRFPRMRRSVQGKGIAQLSFTCRGRTVFMKGRGATTVQLRAPARVESPAGFLRFQGRPYREEIWIHPSRGKSGRCEVVNHLDVEKYLEGLVNSEFRAEWAPSSVEAQVVAARTYAYFQMREGRRKKQRYDMEGTIADQVYEGSLKEDFRAARAVRKTRGLVLTASKKRKNPRPIKAFYHSTCGGKTTLPEKVWGRRQKGFRKTVVCPFCRSSPRFHWNLEMKNGELVQAIFKGARGDRRRPRGWPKNWTDVFKRGKLQSIRADGRDKTGRVNRLQTVWKIPKVNPNSHEQESSMESGLRMLPLKATDFRRWVGSEKLRSTSFTIGTRGKKWRFEGRGNGHGVGMCQWGAKVMGEQGHSAKFILRHYYPDTKLAKLW